MMSIEETAATWRITSRLLSIEAACRSTSTASAHPVTSRVRAAGAEHQVVTLEGGTGAYRRSPCPECPWRLDRVGVFPPEAFVHSAETAYDVTMTTFACHQSGKANPAMCAGFLLRGAEHNLTVRLGHIHGQFKRTVHDGGHALHASYREMAIANGVAPDHPALEPCR